MINKQFTSMSPLPPTEANDGEITPYVDESFFSTFIEDNHVLNHCNKFNQQSNHGKGKVQNDQTFLKQFQQKPYRGYKCAHYIGCKFDFYFGEKSKTDGDNDDALPKKYCKNYNLLHCGKKWPEFASDGRAWKEVVMVSLTESVKIASETKQKLPVPKDIMKTANNILDMNV